MKKNISIILLLLTLIGFSACKKHKDYPKFAKPNWEVDTTGKYPYSMTAVVQLPDNLKARFKQGDELGAFMKGECRGLARLVNVDSNTVFFVQIHGAASEGAAINFEYYSTSSSYLYQTSYFLDFTVDGNYGTVDRPKILDLKPLK